MQACLGLRQACCCLRTGRAAGEGAAAPPCALAAARRLRLLLRLLLLLLRRVADVQKFAAIAKVHDRLHKCLHHGRWDTSAVATASACRCMATCLNQSISAPQHHQKHKGRMDCRTWPWRCTNSSEQPWQAARAAGAPGRRRTISHSEKSEQSWEGATPAAAATLCGQESGMMRQFTYGPGATQRMTGYAFCHRKKSRVL